MKKILLALDAENNNKLKSFFTNDLDYEIVGTTIAGDEAIDFIVNKQPDIVILDLILQNKDGYCVLDYIQNKLVANKPKVLVLTALTQDSFVTKALQNGASDFLAKPCSNETVRNHLSLIINNIEGEHTMINNKTALIEEKITNIFLTMGIPAHIKGYQFLREAILLTIDNPAIINNITKELYPAVANRFETSSSKVERAIRHAIEVAWNRGKIENINSIFGIKVYDNNDKPTNSEFIALISDKMLIDKQNIL